MDISRFKKNPILKPNKEQSWEAVAVFNGCPIKKENKTYLFYRAVSLSHYHSAVQTKMSISNIGIAESENGSDFSNRRRFLIPEESWEKYGCEDPRVTYLDGKYYIFYTALSTFPFSADGIKVGLAISKDLKKVDEKHLITPFNAKAMTLFPEKINGKMVAILTANTDRPPSKIALAKFKNEKEMLSLKYWNNWYKNLDEHELKLQRSPDDHVEIGAPPLKTKHGWLLVYSYIKNYHSTKRLFGIEAVLLDLKNPSKVLASTVAPLMVPEETYELYGMVPNILFPSGALLDDDDLKIYYGAADTVCCVASISLKLLLQTMSIANQCRARLTRVDENPILTPLKKHTWESKAVFNPAAIYLDGRVHIIYRAMSEDNTSVMGYAESKDGIHIDKRYSEPIYVPREDFENKKIPNGNSGCEDPRITLIDDKLYMFYTAFDGKNPPRIALASILIDRFLKKDWNWSRPVLISPPDFDNKDACLFPEKVNDKYLIFHRMGTDIDIALVSDLEFEPKEWLEERRWLKLRPGYWDDERVGVAAPPVKTSKGWILLYHGVSSSDHVYRVGAVLLDKENPTRILGRTNYPIFEPKENYELMGQVNNVVFPCGNVILDNNLFVYYGGADSVVGVAFVGLEEFLKIFDV